MPTTYKCIRKCFHRGILYNVDDPYAPMPGEKVPRHFREIRTSEEPKQAAELQDLTKVQLVEEAKRLAIPLEEMELDEKSRKTELIAAIRGKLRDAKLNLPPTVE